jgi:hypothetical protein
VPNVIFFSTSFLTNNIILFSKDSENAILLISPFFEQKDVISYPIIKPQLSEQELIKLEQAKFKIKEIPDIKNDPIKPVNTPLGPQLIQHPYQSLTVGMEFMDIITSTLCKIPLSLPAFSLPAFSTTLSNQFIAFSTTVSNQYIKISTTISNQCIPFSSILPQYWFSALFSSLSSGKRGAF